MPGWTGIIPNFGLLSDEFSEPRLKIWTIDKASKSAKFNDFITIKTDKPFCGEAGVARGLAGAFSTIPPYRTGISCPYHTQEMLLLIRY